VQANLGYPRERLGLLYLAGGATSFAAMRVAGPVVDHTGAFKVGSTASVVMAVVIYLGFVEFWPGLTVVGIFIGLMAASSFRNIAYNALTSRVPSVEQRARFMSLQSAVQHFASAVGAMASTRLLVVASDGQLVGMDTLGFIAIASTSLVPVFLWWVQARVERQERSALRPLAAPA
jgi:predicted MFS family arabinose efflux permease